MSSKQTHESSPPHHYSVSSSRRRHDTSDSKARRLVERRAEKVPSRGRSRSPWRKAAPLRRPSAGGGFRRRSPYRRSSMDSLAQTKKPAPVNELDASCMTLTKDHKPKSDGSLNLRFSSTFHNRGVRNVFNRTAFGGRFDTMHGRGMIRRTPGFAPPRPTGGRDAPHGRSDFGTSRRDEETRKGNEDKPVMNLLDPCKVPTGRSYFTHDDRSAESRRARVSRYSDGFSDRSRVDRAPIGWRNNAAFEGRDRGYGDSRGPYQQRRTEMSRPSDGVWKHDLFDEQEDGMERDE